MADLDSIRAEIVQLRTTITTSDSKRETAVAIQKRDALIKQLRDICPHDLIIVKYSEGRDYDENCAVAGMHMCVRCGLSETGYQAEVDRRNYAWCSGTYKTLVKEPFARFELQSKYDNRPDKDGDWVKGDPLDHPLGELLTWIKTKGYKHASAAWLKAYDERKRAEEVEAQYQRFKTANIDRLRREFQEEGETKA